jgi:hypothetical protein
MIAYEVYKIAHLLCLFIFFTTSSILLWYGGRVRTLSILGGISSFLILVTGMGLMARLNIGHTEAWPLWIKVKMGIWIGLTIGAPVVSKRFPKLGKLFYFLAMGLFFVAAYAVIYKID